MSPSESATKSPLGLRATRFGSITCNSIFARPQNTKWRRSVDRSSSIVTSSSGEALAPDACTAARHIVADSPQIKQTVQVAVLPGDGIGTEVMEAALRVLTAAFEGSTLQLELN